MTQSSYFQRHFDLIVFEIILSSFRAPKVTEMLEVKATPYNDCNLCQLPLFVPLNRTRNDKEIIRLC